MFYKRSDGVIVVGVLLLLFGGIAVLVGALFPTDPGPILIDDFRPSASAAVDSNSCAVLAEHQLHLYGEKDPRTYADAIGGGQIVELRNGTEAKIIEVVFYDKGRFRPFASVSAEDLRERELLKMYWIIPKEGPFKGIRLCVSDAVMHYKHAIM